MQPTIWTIGHSTRPLDVFLGLLDRHGIAAVADVRRFPGSRRHPQFGGEALQATLEGRGQAYRWIPELGGRRKPLPDSPNAVWTNDAFRGYADYMQTPAFAAALGAVVADAALRPTSLMCAEAPWWRCHRALISDALRARGWRVLHIMDAPKAAEHPYTAPARIVDGTLTYAVGGLF